MQIKRLAMGKGKSKTQVGSSLAVSSWSFGSRPVDVMQQAFTSNAFHGIRLLLKTKWFPNFSRECNSSAASTPWRGTVAFFLELLLSRLGVSDPIFEAPEVVPTPGCWFFCLITFDVEGSGLQVGRGVRAGGVGALLLPVKKKLEERG